MICVSLQTTSGVLPFPVREPNCAAPSSVPARCRRCGRVWEASSMDSGTLSIPSEDSLATQLQQITEEHNVDEQLASMRQQLQISSSGTPLQLIQGPERSRTV